jgi:hypothetical protein
VPPEKDTVADSRGRFGSGSAYDVGQGGDAEEAALGGRLAMGLAVGAGGGVGDVATVGEGVGDGEGATPAVGVDVLHPAASEAMTSHEVRTRRR